MQTTFRNIATQILCCLLLAGLFNMPSTAQTTTQLLEISYSHLLTDVREKRVKAVTISGIRLNGQYTDGTPFITYLPNDPQLIADLRAGNVIISVRPPEADEPPALLNAVMAWLPILLLCGTIVFACRRRRE